MPATVRKLDFTDVKDQGQFNRRRKPSGEYRAKIVAVDDHESKEGNDNFVFTVMIDGDRRASYPYYCGLQVKQLWKLRNLFVATGLRAPGGKAKIDPNKLTNRTLGVLLDDDEYEGRLNSVIADIFPIAEGGEFLNDGASSKKSAKRSVDDDDEDDEEEEKPTKKSSKKAIIEDDDEDDEPPVKKGKKTKVAVVVEDDDDDEDDDEEDEPPAKKSTKKAAKKPVVEDDDDDEDEDEDEPPVKKSKKSSKKKRRVSDDEDDELDTDDL